MTKALAEDLAALEAELEQLREDVDCGETADLDQVEPRVQRVAEQAETLDTSALAAMRPRIEAVLRQYDELARTIHRELDRLKDQLQTQNQRTAAVRTYEQVQAKGGGSGQT